MGSEAFYLPRGDGRYVATENTTGPWDPAAQHAGPPAALLGGALERTADQPLARLTFEILRPVPIAELTVTTEVVRPGKAVSLVQGTLADDRGPCLLARAWGIRTAPVGIPVVPSRAAGLPGLEEGREVPFFDGTAEVGWHTAMELRFVSGTGLVSPGPGKVWARPRMPLIDGQEPTNLERLLLTADAGNGVSAEADPSQWLFINTELTVHLHRQPVGEWIGMSAVSVYEPHGVGHAESVLYDQDGPVGRGAQALYLAPHPRAGERSAG